MKDAFNINDFLGIIEQGVKINKRREDREASVKSSSFKVTAPSLEDLFEASEPIEVVEASVNLGDSSNSDGLKIIDMDDYQEELESHKNTISDEQEKNSEIEISKNSGFDELSKKVENVKNGADVPISYDERACSKEENSKTSADIEISKRTEEKSIFKNLNSNSDVKNSISPTLEPNFENDFVDVVSEVEPVERDNSHSNISYSSEFVESPSVVKESGASTVDSSVVETPSVCLDVSGYPVAISDEQVSPVVLYFVDSESWDDAHTDFSFDDCDDFESTSSEEDFDIEYDGESELDDMDMPLSSPPASSVVALDSDFDEEVEDDYSDDNDEVESSDIYDVVFDDEDDEFDDYDDDDSESIVSESGDIYDVDDDEDYVDEEEEEEYLDDSGYEEPAPEYDFSESKPASAVFGNVDFEGGEPSAPTDEDIDEMETDFDIEEDDLEDEPPSIPVKSVSPEDEMDVEASHRVKSKPSPVYKTFDDANDDEFTRRAFERAMGSRVQAKINVDESKKEDVVISDNFEEVESDEVNLSVGTLAEEQASEVKEKPSVSSELSSEVVSPLKDSVNESKSLGIRDVSAPEKEEPAVKFVKGMSLKDFLRENPSIRQEEEVLKFFSKADIVQAERRSQIMIRRGKIIL